MMRLKSNRIVLSVIVLLMSAYFAMSAAAEDKINPSDSKHIEWDVWDFGGTKVLGFPPLPYVLENDGKRECFDRPIKRHTLLDCHTSNSAARFVDHEGRIWDVCGSNSVADLAAKRTGIDSSDSIISKSEGKKQELNTLVIGDSASEKDRSIEAHCVSMGNSAFIQIAPDEKDQNKRSIFSFEFGGCTGTVLYALLKSGKQRAALTHYDPTNTARHLSKIRDLCIKLKQDTSSDEIAKVLAIIFHPGTWAKNPETGYYSLVPEDPLLVDCLSNTITAEFDSNIKIIQELYAARSSTAEFDSNIIIQKLYAARSSLHGAYHPEGMFENKMFPKDLEIVLNVNPKESYFQSKATYHKKQNISAL